MKLFLVKSIVNIPPYDRMVICAENERQARELATLYYPISSESIKSCKELSEGPQVIFRE